MKALYLEPDEEITSVVDRLREIEDKDVAIVVPKRAGLLQSIINLKLLRYQGEQLKKELSIVTTDKTGRNLASAVGLTVYQKLPDAGIKEAAVKERDHTRVPINFRKTARTAPKEVPPEPLRKRGAKLTKQQVPDVFEELETQIEPDEPELTRAAEPAEAKPPKAKRQFKVPSIKLPSLTLPKISPPRLKGSRRWIVPIAVALIVLLGGGVVAAAVLPRATVTVTPKTDPLAVDVPVTFSVKATAPDLAGKVLPAKTIEVTKQAQVSVTATGSGESGGKATGTIKVLNTMGRGQSLVARTRFQAPDGRIYRSQSAVTVPGRGEIEVTVTADEGGEAGNLPADTRLSIPGLRGTAVYGQAIQPLSGGTNSAVPSVSAADAEKGRADLAAKAAKEGADEARGKLAVGNTLNDQVVTTDVDALNVTPPVGAQTPNFTVSGTVKVVYFTYNDEDLQKIVYAELGPKVPGGTDLVASATRETYLPIQPSADRLAGTLKITTAVTQSVSREQLQQQLVGKSPDQAIADLRATGKLSDIRVSLSPFWVRTIPKSAGKISITYADAGPSPSPTPSPTSVLPETNASPPPQI